MKQTVHRLNLNVFKSVAKILNVFEIAHVTFQAVLNDVHVTKNVMMDVHVRLKTIIVTSLMTHPIVTIVTHQMTAQAIQVLINSTYSLPLSTYHFHFYFFTFKRQHIQKFWIKTI